MTKDFGRLHVVTATVRREELLLNMYLANKFSRNVRCFIGFFRGLNKVKREESFYFSRENCRFSALMNCDNLRPRFINGARRLRQTIFRQFEPRNININFQPCVPFDGYREGSRGTRPWKKSRNWRIPLETRSFLVAKVTWEIMEILTS